MEREKSPWRLVERLAAPPLVLALKPTKPLVHA